MSDSIPIQLTCMRCRLEFPGTLQRGETGPGLVTVDAEYGVVGANSARMRMVKYEGDPWLCFDCHQEFAEWLKTPPRGERRCTYPTTPPSGGYTSVYDKICVGPPPEIP